jgi:DNA-binding NarL/FixJ family response regulator
MSQVTPLPSAARTSLSASELELAELVADGLTNREIGACLYLSPKTIERRLSLLYRRLGCRSRTELTLRLAGGRPPIPLRPELLEDVTDRELHVARLAAGGLTNSELCDELQLHRRTVEQHLASVYRKLELRSRAQLAVHLAAA